MTSYKKALAALFIVPLFFLGGCSIAKYFTSNEPVPLAEREFTSHTPKYRHGDWTVARASLHNHTIISDGCREPADLIKQARREGMSILAITDHREGDFCYKDTGMCITFNGIEKIGYDEYFKRLRKLKRENPDLIVLIGVEVMPWFYNAGKFPHMVITNQNAHFTVYDIHDPSIYADMPARRKLDTLEPELDPGIKPYRNFVNYIKDHGGIVHAVHVESYQDIWSGRIIHATSVPRPYHVFELPGLTGFSILPQGRQIAGAAGGYWDTVLSDYMLGFREEPLWANADADYHGPKGSLFRSTTLFYMKEWSEEEVYRCMREGRMVSLQGRAFQDTYVTEFSVSADGEPAGPIMFGKDITLSEPPVVRFSLDHPIKNVTVKLIRNGEVIYETDECSFQYRDREVFIKNLPAFYRVEVEGPYLEPEEGKRPSTEPASMLFTNPVFVRMKGIADFSERLSEWMDNLQYICREG
ncbi:MAG: PHP domain-containing protein [bacterium]